VAPLRARLVPARRAFGTRPPAAAAAEHLGKSLPNPEKTPASTDLAQLFDLYDAHFYAGAVGAALGQRGNGSG
jgi:hypothetical protein